MKMLTPAGLCFTFILFALSCKKDEPPPKDPLAVNSTHITLQGHLGYVDSFTIQYAGNWTITKNPATASWLSLSATSGSGNATIYLSTTENNTLNSPRSAALAVIPDGNESKKVNITVIQSRFGSLAWSKLYGGSSYDALNKIIPTPEGGYIAVGYALSPDGDAAGNHGDWDAWVVKLDNTGSLIWKKCYGGSGPDRAYNITPANDGGYIIVGVAQSNDGDVTGHKYYGDYWIWKIDGNGTLVWNKTYGGSGSEEAYAVVSTADNGYLVAGRTTSHDWDVTGFHGTPGNNDVWLVKLDVAGNLQWEKAYGGDTQDYGLSLTKSPDGGYVVAGYSNASTTNGDVQPTRGDYDVWEFKTDASGNLQWQKTYGGTKEDQARHVLTLPDGYLIGGYTASNDGQVTGNHGDRDAWILKIDFSGNLQWQKAYGGMYDEMVHHIIRDGNAFVFAASTGSRDGDIINAISSNDAWIVKIDASGNKLMRKNFGGSEYEGAATCIMMNADNSYTVTAYTASNNVDVPANNHGLYDGWVFKFRW
jgi:hypothetical protein